MSPAQLGQVFLQVIGAAAIGLIVGLIIIKILARYQKTDRGLQVLTIISCMALGIIVRGFIGSNDSPNMDHALQQIPIFQTLKAQDPGTYKQVLNTVQAGIEQGKTPSSLLTQAYQSVAHYILQALPQTSEQALWQYSETFLAQLATLNQQQQYSACTRLIYGEIPNSAAYNQALAAILKNDQHIVQPIDRAAVRAQLTQRLDDIKAQYDIEAYALITRSRPAQTPAQQSLLCRTSYAFYQPLIQPHRQSNLHILRYLYGRNL